MTWPPGKLLAASPCKQAVALGTSSAEEVISSKHDISPLLLMQMSKGPCKSFGDGPINKFAQFIV
jgi:hypothetical protein